MLTPNVGYFANWPRMQFDNTKSEPTRLLIADYILNAILWKDTYISLPPPNSEDCIFISACFVSLSIY